MEEKILKLILQELKEKEQSLSSNLGYGVATDYAAYQNMCGQIKGLMFAQSIASDLLRKMEQYRDE